MYAINRYKSIKLLKDFVLGYNAGKKLSAQIKPQHISLVEEMLVCYNQQLKKLQAYGEGLKKGLELPLFRTNNVQLAKRIGRCEKTARNLRERLVEAKIITNTAKEGFRGSNASFDIALSPMILHISKRGDSANCTPLFFTDFGKSLPHTVSSTNQVTIKSINISGDDFQQSEGNQALEADLGVDNGIEAVDNDLGNVENHLGKHIQVTQEPQELGQVTQEAETDQEQLQKVAPKRFKKAEIPALAPDSVAEAVEGLEEKAATAVKGHVQRLWTVVLLNLYKDAYLTESEIERGKGRIAEYFIYTKPQHYSQVSNEFTERIILAKKWIDRVRAKGGKWTTTIPSVYFDIRFEKGFKNTKSWFKKMQKKRQEINEKTLITKSVNKYMNSLSEDSKISPADAYFQITQRLGKKSKRLVKLFNEQIAGMAKAN